MCDDDHSEGDMAAVLASCAALTAPSKTQAPSRPSSGVLPNVLCEGVEKALLSIRVFVFTDTEASRSVRFELNGELTISV